MPGADAALFASTWVHVFEEDTAEGQVYRPEDGPIPLSRRPRERLVLSPDGSATVYSGAPDDRLTPASGSWREEDGVVVVRRPDGTEARVVRLSPGRLVMRRN